MRPYIQNSDDLHAPEVHATFLGFLASGTYESVHAAMEEEAAKRGMSNPRMVVDLLIRPEKAEEVGGTSTVCEALPEDWEGLAESAPHYFVEDEPSVYMVNGDQYVLPI